MLVQPIYSMSVAAARQLIERHGWATLVTHGESGMKASHLPCLLDPELDPGGDAADLILLGHLARSDPQSQHLIDGADALLIFEGASGYISAAWYERDPFVPTWNYSAVHVHGRPEVLDGEDGFAVLERTVEHFEARRQQPWRLANEPLRYAHRIAAGTLPFRLRATEIEAKEKLGQDKPSVLRRRVIAALETPGPYQNPSLAEAMRGALDGERAVGADEAQSQGGGL